MSVIRKVARRLMPNFGAPQQASHQTGTAWSIDRRCLPKSSVDVARSVDHVVALDARMWETRSPDDIVRLSEAVRLADRGSHASILGSLALSRWALHVGETESALAWLQDLKSQDPALQWEADLLRIDCLCEKGEGSAALSHLSRLIGRSTTDRHLLLRSAHARHLLGPLSGHGSGSVVEALNTLYRDAGFGMLRRDDVTAPTGLDNLGFGVPESEPREALPRVSVVTWLRDPEELFGLRSLVHQSWTNLEIFVLTGHRMRERLAPALIADDRVTFVKDVDPEEHPLLVGARHATGELVSLHPPDTWAHPQRVEAQASALSADPEQHGNISSHMRVKSDLAPRSLGRAAWPELVGPNPHTAMLRVEHRTPQELLAVFHEDVLARYTATNGALRPAAGIGLTHERVPLNLSTADLPSEASVATVSFA